MVVRGRGSGWGKRGKAVKRRKLPVISKSWGVVFSTVPIVNHTVLRIWKLLRVNLERYHKKIFCNYVWWWILTRLIMVIILQHIHADVNSLCCTPETNIRLYVSYTSIKKKLLVRMWLVTYTGWDRKVIRQVESKEPWVCRVEKPFTSRAAGWVQIWTLHTRLSDSEFWGCSWVRAPQMSWSAGLDDRASERRKHGFPGCYLTCQNHWSRSRSKTIAKVSWFLSPQKKSIKKYMK